MGLGLGVMGTSAFVLTSAIPMKQALPPSRTWLGLGLGVGSGSGSGSGSGLGLGLAVAHRHHRLLEGLLEANDLEAQVDLLASGELTDPLHLVRARARVSVRVRVRVSVRVRVRVRARVSSLIICTASHSDEDLIRKSAPSVRAW